MAIQQNGDMHDLKAAFEPRTLDGHKIGMFFDNEPPETLLFPCAHPHPDGTFDPMIMAEDCVDGKLPANYTYEHGLVRPGQIFGGTNFGAICYDDPCFNLPMTEQALLLRAKNELTPAGCSSLQPYLGTVLPAASSVYNELGDWEGSIRPMPSGLILQTERAPFASRTSVSRCSSAALYLKTAGSRILNFCFV